MKNTTRKVLILKNVNSEIIEQAILILKDTAPEVDSQVIREAEKIVEKYMDNKTLKVREDKTKKNALLLSLGVAFVSLSIVIIAIFV